MSENPNPLVHPTIQSWGPMNAFQQGVVLLTAGTIVLIASTMLVKKK